MCIWLGGIKFEVEVVFMSVCVVVESCNWVFDYWGEDDDDKRIDLWD